ncbi:hypothetical protein K469DRAFT_698130 [Zopfia rhizophila CBS 207.26]|uniref:Uncharacterized protein n=1 Tax=Zopfia rhizophila CBS 207.26 TaxID=1314779 RepID=A0A6A6DEQ0_9PEZI|nr:hypothetical protein K469DRAFT_698130 [Zopfia rhizophila CBS 207.26]
MKGDNFNREQWLSELSANEELWKDPNSDWAWSSGSVSANGTSKEEFVKRSDFKNYTWLTTIMKNLDTMEIVGSSPTEVAFIGKQGKLPISGVISINRLRIASVNRGVMLKTMYAFHAGGFLYVGYEIGKQLLS